ncbi:hypothetical protein MSAN_02043500 [Mycena sanguinolenta]|uniref:MYND-type domain-containing protein n=1 Tax=Mycena sanguinolenta TaxID=230812 RepID=A0A8H6XJN1_9AGAR|nr:hypothetical protein MSAN_02043500 [Mycena sanguinolenta]
MTELSEAFSSLVSLSPIQYDDETEIDPAELERLHELEMASHQSEDVDACNTALRALQELATAPGPLSPLTFRVLRVLGEFLAADRIPKNASHGDAFDVLVFSAACAFWSYGVVQIHNPDNTRLNDACVGVLPNALAWISFLHAYFLADSTQNLDLRGNAWSGIMIFLGEVVGNRQMFGSSGDEITLAIVKFWVMEAGLENPPPVEHLPARLLHKLIGIHGEDYEDMVTFAMKSLGPLVVARTAIHHLSAVTGSDSNHNFMETRNETLLIRMMVCTPYLIHPLLSNGVLRTLIKALSWATRESYTDDPATSGIMIWLAQNTCEALQVAIGNSTGVALCRQVLDFGILAPLLRADKWHAHLTPAHFPNVPYIHSRLLIQTLATYTIYPSVLRAAATAIEMVPVKLQANLDKAGPMREAWQQFKDVVQRHLRIPGAPVGPFDRVICSNLFCPLVSPAAAEGSLKRCAGCGDALYCGSSCQTVDWKNHKKFCKEMQAVSYTTPTIPKEETEFARKVALHELETHKDFILQKWRTSPDNHSPGTTYIHRDGSSSFVEPDPHSPKIQVVILDYEINHTSGSLRPTLGFMSAPMFEHLGLPTMEESAQRYRKEWNAIKLLAEKPQKRGKRAGIVVVRIPEGIFRVQKFFSLLCY